MLCSLVDLTNTPEANNEISASGLKLEAKINPCSELELPSGNLKQCCEDEDSHSFQPVNKRAQEDDLTVSNDSFHDEDWDIDTNDSKSDSDSKLDSPKLSK